MLKKTKTVIIASAVSLLLAGALSGCSGGKGSTGPITSGPVGNQTITANSNEAPLTPETPISSDLKKASAPPEWAADVLNPVPNGWIFMNSETQAMAISASYDVSVLKAFVEKKLTEGWSFDVQPVIDNNGYTATLFRGSVGEYLTVVGAVTGAPAADGSNNSPASSYIYTKPTK